jgi:2-dehydropantoate 2-reductase
LPGSSSWQSLARGTGNIEADFLNGEIVLLGRLHGTPTPANAVLQRLANDLAVTKGQPQSIPLADIQKLIAEA